MPSIFIIQISEDPNIIQTQSVIQKVTCMINLIDQATNRYYCYFFLNSYFAIAKYPAFSFKRLRAKYEELIFRRHLKRFTVLLFCQLAVIVIKWDEIFISSVWIRQEKEENDHQLFSIAYTFDGNTVGI